MNAEIHLCLFSAMCCLLFLASCGIWSKPSRQLSFSETGKSRAIPTPFPGTRRHTDLLPAQLWLQSKCFPVSQVPHCLCQTWSSQTPLPGWRQVKTSLERQDDLLPTSHCSSSQATGISSIHGPQADPLQLIMTVK